MAIRMTVTHERYRRPTRATGWRSERKGKTFDVDLISPDEMEFPNIDVRAMKSAQALGLRVYDVFLDFYYEYTSEDGFWNFSLDPNRLQAFWRALEDQGYDKFNHGDFSRQQFAEVLGRLIGRTKSKILGEVAIRILNKLVTITGDELDIFPVADYHQILKVALRNGVGNTKSIIKTLHPLYAERFSGVKIGDDWVDELEDRYDDEEYQSYEDLEEYVHALIAALSEAKPKEVKTILDELMLYIDRDEFDYEEEDITPRWSDDGHEGLGYRRTSFKHTITIWHDTVFEWVRVLEKEICDIIHFASCYTDLCEASNDYCAPEAATAILKYFGEKESKYGEESIEAPDEPWHPEPDEDGDAGILYQRFKWDKAKGAYSDTELEEEVLVRYGSEADRNDAIMLSTHVLKELGDEDAWAITPMWLDGDEWVEED